LLLRAPGTAPEGSMAVEGGSLPLHHFRGGGIHVAADPDPRCTCHLVLRFNVLDEVADLLLEYASVIPGSCSTVLLLDEVLGMLLPSST
jgi:hypothetical protein